eukprot:NODE_3018_length_953_cov_121.197337_g2998_i0.p1 GENE.NODE_3018_length_953_cov_121.197337_g2998_i0~~NODE_3018_length_953_cov_121.197337_g2998_i0.p1  ORF type:complete len:306 (+),score=26.71 NODE_3018_length_953_cov_121.197337_g2998_i0:77-919(+)
MALLPAKCQSLLEVINCAHNVPITVHPTIPGNKLTSVQNRCRLAPGEEILALLDCSVFGSASSFTVFSTHGIHVRHDWTRGGDFCPYADLVGQVVHADGHEVQLSKTVWANLAGSGCDTQAFMTLMQSVQRLLSDSRPSTPPRTVESRLPWTPPKSPEFHVPADALGVLMSPSAYLASPSKVQLERLERQAPLQLPSKAQCLALTPLELDDVIAQLRGALATAEEVRAEKNLCVVCLTASRSAIFLPCKHKCACTACSQRVQTCPLCRARIHDRIEPFDV